MEKSRPQLSLIELRQLRWLLGGLIGVLSAWTVFYMEVDALVTLAVITLVVPVFTLFPRLARGLPPVFHRLAFPVIVVLFALDWWSTREPLPAMIRLDLMLLCYRCIAPRSRRDDLQLILLALFAVVVTGVYTVSIAFVAQILLFTAASLALLLTITLSDARGSGRPAAGDAVADAGWERVRWAELFARVRAAADLRVAALGGALFAGVVVLSGVLFLTLPRFEISNDFFLDRLISKQSRTGFSENVTFQDVVDIQQDTSVAMMVDVDRPERVPLELYWRMIVLDEYSGQGFRMSTVLRSTLVPSREKVQAHPGGGVWEGDDTVWTVYFQSGVSRYLPLMGGYGQITFGEPQALVRSRPLRLAALPNDPAKMVAYRVEGMDTDGILPDPDFERLGFVRSPEWRREAAIAGEGEDGARQATFLELAFENPADLALLRRWVDEIGGAGEGGADFARRAGAWLQSRHGYSLSMRLEPGDGDPLVRWMGSEEPGHCEMFAGALVVLARAAGVPARLVTGFRGGVWNPNSASITVRNSDAHAWTEIWDAQLGAWLRADATPGSLITPSPGADFGPGASALEQDSGWSARIDGLRVFWYRRIVNFDREAQGDIMKATKDVVGAGLKSARLALEQVLRVVVDWMRAPWDFSRVAASVAALLPGVLLFWLWRRAGRAWWLAWRSRRAASHRRDPVRIEASRWLLRLAKAERTRGGTGREVEDAVESARAGLLRLRYGAREGWAPPAQVIRSARRALRELRRAHRG
jgi:hypothetical protein